MRTMRLCLVGAVILALLGGPVAVGRSEGSPDPMRPDDDSDKTVALTPAAVERAVELEQFIHEYEATWDSHDLDGFAAFLSDEEFLFVEPGRRLDSKQEFIDLMGPYLTDPEHVGASDRRFHVGADELVEAYQTWGFAGATADDPLVEVDLFTVRDDRITSVQAMYGADMLRRFSSVDPTDLIRRYEVTWSSGDAELVEALYAENAGRSESLYGIELRGRGAIGREARAYFERHPGASTTVIEPYIFGDATIGGAAFVLADDRGCDVESTVLLETDETGAITHERVYYDIASVMSCDWQR